MTIYSTGCPKCKALEKELKKHNISFQVESDIEVLKAMGISTVPVLRDGDKFFSFEQAIKYLRENY